MAATTRVAARYATAMIAADHASPIVLIARSVQPRLVPSTSIHQFVWLMPSNKMPPRYTINNGASPGPAPGSRLRPSCAIAPYSAPNPSPCLTQDRPQYAAPASTAAVYRARNTATSCGVGG